LKVLVHGKAASLSVQLHIASELTVEDAEGRLKPVPSQSHFLIAMSRIQEMVLEAERLVSTFL
jgi:hypothetical protein